MTVPTTIERSSGSAPRPSLVPAAAHAVSEEAAWSPLEIATERCKGCELCITVCPHGVLALDPTFVNHLGYHPIRLTDAAGCTSCVLCARVCPDVVFTVYAPRKEARP